MDHPSEPASLDQSRGFPIAYRPYGLKGDQCPVVMLHGLESHSGWFVQSARYMASLGHPVYALDRRGSGCSEAPRGECDDFHDLLNEVAALSQHLMTTHACRRFHLFGHCFGAVPATAYACRHPTALASLILATPAIYTLEEPGFAAKLKILWAGLRGTGSHIPVALQAQWFTDQEEFIDFIRADALALRTVNARLYWETLRARRFIQRHEASLAMPVMMALAGRDRICDNRRDAALFERLPGRDKRCVTYPEAIHILEFSGAREAFFTDLQEWLTGHPSP